MIAEGYLVWRGQSLNRVYIEVTEGRREINVDEISKVKSSWPSVTSM